MTPDLLVAVRTLRDFIQANMPELAAVYDEWPDPKDRLETPCLTIVTAGNPTYTHCFPNLVKRIPGSLSVYSVGFYDMNLQLDLWCEYKLQRAELFDKLINVFNKQFIDSEKPTGLSLVLTDYHEAIARYDQSGYTFMDSGDGLQRAEWRAKIDVTVNHFKLVEKSESTMDQITLSSEIAEKENSGFETVVYED